MALFVVAQKRHTASSVSGRKKKNVRPKRGKKARCPPPAIPFSALTTGVVRCVRVSEGESHARAEKSRVGAITAPVTHRNDLGRRVSVALPDPSHGLGVG